MKFLVLIIVLICLQIEARESQKSRKYGRKYETSDDSDDFDRMFSNYGRYGSYNVDSSRRKYRRDYGRDYGRNYGRDYSRKVKYTKLKMDRKMFYYWDSVYQDWTNWTQCDPVTCVSSRRRQCKDSSWEEDVRNFKLERKCPVKTIYERRSCSDVKECSKDFVSANNDSINSLPTSCGRRPQFIQTKVFGGRETFKNSWPWHGGLYVTGTYKSPIYICGATLINPGWAVTAAHCLRTLQSIDSVPLGEVVDTRKYNFFDKFQLIFGDHDRNEKERSEKATKISHIVIHPSFRADYTSNLYDVALLKLETLLPQQKNIDFACIPDSINYTLNTDATCHAIGWGHVTSQDPFNIWSLEFNWIFDKSGRSRERPGSTKRDTCRGDSGGGLFCMDPDTNRWQLYGITNFGSARGCGKSYGVYVRVAALVDWIKEILNMSI